MSNSKISALTSATTPLAGTEVLPIVQSSSTKKIAVDDLTVKNVRSNATTGILQITGPAAGSTRIATVPNANWTAARTDAAQSFTGDQTLSTGNLVIGTSGKGIDFSATPGTGTSELLADYEEGTWTPTDVSGIGLPITVDHAVYTKIGRLITVNAYITYPVTASTAIALISLPYTPAKYDIGTASATNGNVYSSITIGGSAQTSFRNSFAVILTNANLSGAQILFTISYTG